MGIDLILLGIVVLALTLYAVLGGADFGAGVWEFNTALQSSEQERSLIYRAIGPVWEANHVWLIFVIVAMFSAFPPAFAGICRALWLPLLLALTGIVFRGAAYAFRVQLLDSQRQAVALECRVRAGLYRRAVFPGRRTRGRGLGPLGSQRVGRI